MENDGKRWKKIEKHCNSPAQPKHPQQTQGNQTTGIRYDAEQKIQTRHGDNGGVKNIPLMVFVEKGVIVPAPQTNDFKNHFKQKKKREKNAHCGEHGRVPRRHVVVFHR